MPRQCTNLVDEPQPDGKIKHTCLDCGNSVTVDAKAKWFLMVCRAPQPESAKGDKPVAAGRPPRKSCCGQVDKTPISPRDKR